MTNGWVWPFPEIHTINPVIFHKYDYNLHLPFQVKKKGLVKSWTHCESLRLCRARPRHFITTWPVKWDEKPVKWLHTQHLGVLSDSSHPCAYFRISEEANIFKCSNAADFKCTALYLYCRNTQNFIATWNTSDIHICMNTELHIQISIVSLVLHPTTHFAGN